MNQHFARMGRNWTIVLRNYYHYILDTIYCIWYLFSIPRGKGARWNFRGAY